MPKELKKVLAGLTFVLLGSAFFLLLQAKHGRDYDAKYDSAVLTGMSPESVRGRLGEPDLITEAGAWVYNERGGDAVLRFEGGRVALVKRDLQRMP